MPRNIAFPAIALSSLLAVTACGTPQQQCIRKNTSEYRNVSRLLQETEANLARGYAWEERTVTRTRWTECRDVDRDRDGNVIVRTRSCLRDYTDIERFRVAIDPLVEQRIRDNLAAKKRELEPRAAATIRACREAFPEDEQG